MYNTMEKFHEETPFIIVFYFYKLSIYAIKRLEQKVHVFLSWLRSTWFELIHVK